MKTLLTTLLLLALPFTSQAATIKITYSGTLHQLFEGTSASLLAPGVEKGSRIKVNFYVSEPIGARTSLYHPDYQSVYKSTSTPFLRTEIEGFHFNTASIQETHAATQLLNQISVLNNSITSSGLDGLAIWDNYLADVGEGCSYLTRKDGCFYSSFGMSQHTYFPGDTVDNTSVPESIAKTQLLNALGAPYSHSLFFKYFNGLNGANEYAEGKILLDSVRVAPVPLPAGIWLFITALAATGILNRRASSRASMHKPA